MNLPLAHIGHWYAEILYVAPAVVMVAWLTVSGKLEKQRARREQTTATRPPGHEKPLG